MNDRFKFRVWDKRLNRYLGNNDPTQMLLENGNLAYLDDEGMKFYEVEFCTGLKDKNGKLIYEGDIILVEDNKCLVEWESENARYNVVGYGEIAYLNYNDIEVIGNIHENTDLLENEE